MNFMRPGHTNTVAVPKVLADPTHPNLLEALLTVAAAITEASHEDTRLWLQGGNTQDYRLVNSLLRIPRAVPSLPLIQEAAAGICAATAAVLVNTLYVARRHAWVLPGSDTRDTLVAQVLNPDLWHAIIKHGMLSFAASLPLQPGILHVERASEDTSQGGQPAWTPLHVCCHLLAALALEDLWPAYMAKVRFEVGHLAQTWVFQDLLEIASDEPCEMPWLVMATVARCHQLRATLCWLELADDSQLLAGLVEPLLESTQAEGLAAVSEVAAASWEECRRVFAEAVEEEEEVIARRREERITQERDQQQVASSAAVGQDDLRGLVRSRRRLQAAHAAKVTATPPGEDVFPGAEVDQGAEASAVGAGAAAAATEDCRPRSKPGVLAAVAAAAGEMCWQLLTGWIWRQRDCQHQGGS